MRLMGWEWWSALLAASFLACIPLVGWLGYFVLAVMGGYYLWQADFSWRDAIMGPAPSTFTFASLSPEQLTEYKRRMKPTVERICKDEAKTREGFEGKIPAHVSNFCECYARTTAEMVTKEDLIYHETTNDYPADFENRMKTALRANCGR
jgi:hypothetical protein